MSFLFPNRFVFGSNQGRLTFYYLDRKEIFSFIIEQLIMKQVVKVIELPNKITEIKKHMYYVMTQGNLFALTKVDHAM